VWTGLAGIVMFAAAAVGCSSAATDGAGDGGPAQGDVVEGTPVRMARATWDTGWFQAEVYRQLLDELGYAVTDPAEQTVDAATFYPVVARGELDLWANGWFPLHEPFLDRELVTGQTIEQSITPVGSQVPGGALQGFLVDRATADSLDLTSMDDFERPEVVETFDRDGNGLADLVGCNDGWGCQLAIDDHLQESAWGADVEQVTGDYPDLLDEVRARVSAGEPALFYTWTPNWTVAVLEPGADVVWLEAPPLPDEQAPTEVADLAGCAASPPCQLGWPVNDIRAVANTDFLDANPPVGRLLEAVQLPLGDIAGQNARMEDAEDYTAGDLEADAAAWIEDNRARVDEWLATARDVRSG
jgi:glycine betaine/proline transport system substrate-binding protein